ncbi:hypothetical protein DFJ73DRAFT_810592 [Zopfochytrium polystomum]|nr:hypothetical protein DFJ73DRAFT_810592 [Zopfochytrium polystomum]
MFSPHLFSSSSSSSSSAATTDRPLSPAASTASSLGPPPHQHPPYPDGSSPRWPARLVAVAALAALALLPSASAVDPPSGLTNSSSTIMGYVNQCPFYTIKSLGFQNNWLLAAGTAKPNFGNLTNSTGDSYDELWSLRTNATGSWVWSWSASNALENPNSTLTGTSAVYSTFSVKHSSLQIPSSMLFLYNQLSSTLDVLSYWWLNPRETYDRDHPPRSVPLPVSGVLSVSTLDNNFGVYVASGNQIWWVQVTAAYSAGPPSSTVGRNVSSGSWPSALVWTTGAVVAPPVIPTSSVRSSSTNGTATGSRSASGSRTATGTGTGTATATATSSGSLTATVSTRQTTQTTEAEAGSAAKATTYATTFISVWLQTDFSYIYTLSQAETPGSPTYHVHRFPAGGPATSFSSVDPAQYTVSTLPGQPLVTLNASLYPALPSDRSTAPSSMVVNPRTKQIYVGLSNSRNVTSTAGVLVYSPPSGSGGDGSYQLTGWIQTTFVNVQALEVDNDGNMLYIAGDDGSGNGRVDYLSLAGSGTGKSGAVGGRANVGSWLGCGGVVVWTACFALISIAWPGLAAVDL